MSDAPTTPGPLGERFERALVYASRLHGRQRRKGSGAPYISHLLAVAALVLEHGGTEEEAVAALLHDAAEDQGGEAELQNIRREFGAAVAAIVAACSDTLEKPKPPWRARKVEYLTHLISQPEPVRRVSAADKLHNARAILNDYRLVGEAVWGRFRGGREGTLWYYRELVGIFDLQGPESLARELRLVVGELESLARAGAAGAL